MTIGCAKFSIFREGFRGRAFLESTMPAPNFWITLRAEHWLFVDQSDFLGVTRGSGGVVEPAEDRGVERRHLGERGDPDCILLHRVFGERSKDLVTGVGLEGRPTQKVHLGSVQAGSCQRLQGRQA